MAQLTLELVGFLVVLYLVVKKCQSIDLIVNWAALSSLKFVIPG